MKVLFYVSSLTRSAGGLFSATTGLATALAEQGVDVEAAGGADRYFDSDRDAWGPVPLHPYPAEQPSYGLRVRAIADLRRHEPDLVHVHGLWSAVSIYGRAAEALGVPVVVSPHGMLDPWILARRPVVKRVHAALFERPLLRRAWVHALNDVEQAHIAAFLPSARPRTFVVPNGVAALPLPAGTSNKAGTLFLGRLHPKKQVVELVRAWRARAPDDQQLTIAGWGDDGYEAQVRQAVAGATNVAFVGALYGAEKSAALSAARFFILPSLGEGLPMAALEALQHGCIPILTPECNLPDLFRDGIALPMRGDFGDFGAIVATIAELSDAEAAGRSDAAAAYATRFAWPALATRMMALYRTCVGARSGA